MKNFTKQNFKTNPLWIRLLIMGFMLLAGAGNAWAAQYNLNWQGKVYFLAPEKWDISTYSTIQVDITRTTSATTSNHQEYIGKMTRIGTSRLFYIQISANHSGWNQNEYIAFTANSYAYNSGSFNLNGNKLYTTPLDYGCNNSSNYYLFKPSTESQFTTTTNGNTITASYNSSRDKVLKADQTVNIYTNGSSSANGGSVSLKGYYLSSDNAITQSTENSSSASAKYGAAPGSEMILTASAKTGYAFDGWYTAASGGTLLSSSATYTYNVYGAKTIYARFKQSCVTPTISNISIDNASICAGGSATITVTATNATSYQLYTVSGGIYTKSGNVQTSNEFTVSNSGTYAVKALNGTCESSYSTTKTLSIINPSISNITISNNGTICEGSNATITVTATNATTYQLYTVSGGIYTKSGNVQTSNKFTVSTAGTYAVKALNGTCESGYSSTKTLTVKARPTAPTFDAIPAQCGSYTLPTEDKNRVSVNWYTAATGGEKITSVTTSSTYYAEAVDGTCVSENRTDVEITIKTKPTITASKTSCVPYEEITLSSAAGAGTEWSTDGGMLSATSGASVTFKAAPGTYTVTASANDCTDTKTITVECAAEDCSGAQSTDVIITCDPNGYDGDVYCHIWPYGGQGIVAWPGTLGEKVNGIWTWTFKGLDSNTTYDLILNGGDGKGQTNDIDQDVVPGFQYDYTLVHDAWPNSKTTVTKATPNAISAATDPTVTTVSAEQKEGEAAVVIKGFLQATGCAAITKYGFEYKQEGAANFTDVQVTGSKNNCEEWELECEGLEFGETYIFRAKATNTSKEGTGNEIQVTIQGQSTPVVIKAVRNDKTVNESHWADFVALYVQEDGIDAADAKEVKNYTWEYSTDGENWGTNFTGYVLGGASATVGVTNGNAKCNNIRPTKTGKYRVKVTYDNAEELYSNIITITNDGFKLKYPKYGQNAGSDFTFEAANRTIPVFVVKTTENFPDCPASGMPSQDVEGQKAKKSVDVKIFENGNVVYDRKARMNYRGSSSLNFRKKSYAFCTGKEKTKNSKGDVDTGKENLFGLSNGAKDKDWVLYAAMPDPSMMRNRLIFDTYAQMTGKWGVDSKFVELIIDDEYMGVYVLMDKITNNEKRVNITAADGFILKFDKTDVTDRFEDENSEKRNTFTTEKTGKSGIGSYGATFDQRFEIEYPEMEDMSTEKWVEFVNDNVKGKIEAFEKALEVGNYTEVRKLIDYESWADWFIISEFAKNVDAYRASCFFVYNGGKIEARPLWDQELSFDNKSTSGGSDKGCDNYNGLLIQNSGVYSDDFPAPFWFIGHTDKNKSSTITGGLLNDPCFVTMVKNRYKDHLNNALSNGQLTGKITEYQTELTDAAKTRETNTWRPGSGNIYSCNNGDTSYDYVSIANSITAMRNWITNRPAKLTTALEELTGSSVNISIEPSFVETYPWEPFTLTVDAPEGYEYEMTFTKEGADATGNMVVVKGGDIYTVKIKRPTNTLNQLFETVPYLATATLKVADDGCGGMTTPEANVNIRLNDRVEDECPQPSLGQ